MKKAFLAEYSVRTRVVIDIPEGATNDEIDELIHKAAKDNICKDPNGYITMESMDYEEDKEVPYTQECDDHITI